MKEVMSDIEGDLIVNNCVDYSYITSVGGSIDCGFLTTLGEVK